MNTLTPPVSQLKDADMRAAPAALVRAAQRAREIAARTGTPLILAQNGKVVEKIITADMIASITQEE
ncbi:MAG TPA: hypothetical protein DCQ77_06825 [Betaproteobacteria bacterium]|nr:hypothetical protein [Betaproteobacteria bacterium]